MKKKQTIIVIFPLDDIAKPVIRYIRKEFREYRVARVKTESEFLKRLTNFKDPLFVISAVMIPWSDAAEDLPKNYPQSGFRSAGTRCWGNFRKHHPETPWIYFTVLTKTIIRYSKNSDGNTAFVSQFDRNWKESLITKIFNLAGFKESDEEISASLWRNPKMCDILVKGLGTPLSECPIVLVP